jgi:2-keto-4-pentenoate hydratase/2-oxohepta-3-ene-1,7-dioic acid hydratase in catechol pathway
MSVNVVRTTDAWWRLDGDRAIEIDTKAETTRELLADRGAITGASGSGIDVVELELVSPITTPCRVVAQLLNYRSHAIDAGSDPNTLQPTFFRKSSASVSGPFDPIRQPPEVALLDYEIELGIVIGAEIPIGTTVTDDNLADYVAGVIVANDVSAREIQLTKVQVYESKSYPTFTPLGPRLVLLDNDELRRLPELHMPGPDHRQRPHHTPGRGAHQVGQVPEHDRRRRAAHRNPHRHSHFRATENRTENR